MSLKQSKSYKNQVSGHGQWIVLTHRAILFHGSRVKAVFGQDQFVSSKSKPLQILILSRQNVSVDGAVHHSLMFFFSFLVCGLQSTGSFSSEEFVSVHTVFLWYHHCSHKAFSSLIGHMTFTAHLIGLKSSVVSFARLESCRSHSQGGS